MRNWTIGWIAAAGVVFLGFCSADDGLELARGTKTDRPQQPQIAIDAEGGIHVAYGVNNQIHYRRSDDGGATFTNAVTLPSHGILSLGMRRGPRISANDSGICVTFISGKEGKGRDGDLLALRSNDGGQSWLGPTTINDAGDSAREGLHGMAAGPEGQLCAVWLDLRNQRTEVMSSISTDGGESWQKNVLVYRSPGGNVCECCHPSVCFDSNGTIFIMWRNSLDGARDMYLARSDDQGKSFGESVKLGTDTWPLEACPMDGGAIVAIAPNKVATAWRRIQDVNLLIGLGTPARFLGKGEQPWLAATPDGPYIIWLERRGGQVLLSSPSDGQITELSPHGNDPVIASRPSGQGPVVAAWESTVGEIFSIQLQVVAR